MKTILFFSLIIGSLLTSRQPSDVLSTKDETEGIPIRVEFEKGAAHNHPLMAIWVHDSAGNYVETLYVAKSIATSIFPFGSAEGGKWKEGVNRRPAALPHWSHSRGVKAKDGYFVPHPDNPMPDAVTGPTPKDDFVLNTKVSDNVRTPFFVLFEINQPWDWNEYWSNNKYPDDKEYKTSSQPAVVYIAEISSLAPQTVKMKLAGRSHHSGANGKLYKDIETLTTAKNIANEIKVIIK